MSDEPATPDDPPRSPADDTDGAEPTETPGESSAEVTRPTPVRAPRPRPAGGGGRPTTPKPVRAGLERDEDSGTAEAEEVELELPDCALTVRVRGRSRGHTSEGAADLLLLGFHVPGEEEPEREALVVGRSLEELSPRQLEAAWEEGRPPKDPFAPSELFPGTRRGRGRNRGR